MPTYNYTCPECGTQDDIFCKVSERKDQVCTACGTATTQVIRQAPQPHWTSLALGANPSPEAVKKFDSMRKQQREKEEKCKAEHGDYGKSPGS